MELWRLEVDPAGGRPWEVKNLVSSGSKGAAASAMGAGAAAVAMTRQKRAKAAADAVPLAGDGQGSWWAS